jgi:hypothetical protein
LIELAMIEELMNAKQVLVPAKCLFYSFKDSMRR